MPKPKRLCGECGLVQHASVHAGSGWTHDFVDTRSSKRRKPVNPRSDRLADFYREVYVPMVREAVGDGRRPCPVKSPDCSGFVEGLHEVVSRGRAGGLQAAVTEITLRAAIDAGEVVPCCNRCNGWASEHPLEAHDLDLLRHVWEAVSR